MLKQNINMGIKGKFSIKVYREDGSLKEELPEVDNLITDAGINFLLEKKELTRTASGQLFKDLRFNWASIQNPMNKYCIIGTGATEPKNTDISLVKKWNYAKKYQETTTNEYTNSTHPNHLKITNTSKYSFTNTGDSVNLTEIGLAFAYQDSLDLNTGEYVLTTRSLLKDTSNQPVTITLLKGEILDVTYVLDFYIDVSQKESNMSVSIIEGSKQTTKQVKTLTGVSYDKWYVPNPFNSINLNDTPNINFYKYDSAFLSNNNINGNYDFSHFKSLPQTGENYNSLLRNLSRIGSTSNYSNNGRTYSYASTYDQWVSLGYPAQLVFLERPDLSLVPYRESATFSISPYNANAPEGVACIMYTLPMRNAYLYTLFLDPDTGKGIPKKETQILTFTVDITLSRWDG